MSQGPINAFLTGLMRVYAGFNYKYANNLTFA
jgi:hypothetical protein